MEATILTFLNLAAWVAALSASVVTLRRLKAQGEYVMKGRGHVKVPVRWPAVVAVVAWLWIIAGWVM